MKLLFILFLLLPGCAGLDQKFRSAVSEVSVSGEYSDAHGTTLKQGVALKLRDPKDGLAK